MRPWPRDHKEPTLVSFHPGAPQTTHHWLRGTFPLRLQGQGSQVPPRRGFPGLPQGPLSAHPVHSGRDLLK